MPTPTYAPVSAAALLAVAVSLLLAACSGPPSESSASATSAPTPTRSSSPTAQSAPSPSVTAGTDAAPEAGGPRFTTCAAVAGEELLAEVERLGWVGWNMAGEAVGHSPFDDFPGGAPAGQLSCRWGAGPEVATDNVLDLAWAPIDDAAAAEAQVALQAAGFVSTQGDGGTLLQVRGEAGWEDEQGFGQTYLFTPGEVRWGWFRDDIALLRM
ncbi:hypothetical protein ACIQLJ_04840 [Microbacterium sp. NPDC091313]